MKTLKVSLDPQKSLFFNVWFIYDSFWEILNLQASTKNYSHFFGANFGAPKCGTRPFLVGLFCHKFSRAHQRFSFAFLGCINIPKLWFIYVFDVWKKHNFRNQIGPSLVMFLLIIMVHLMILYFIRNNKNPNQQDLKTSNPLKEQQPATLHESSRLAKRFRDPESPQDSWDWDIYLHFDDLWW